MNIGFPSHRLSLKARLGWSYLVILGTGGLATSLVGSWIVSSTIMMQARRAVNHDFAAAKTVYDQRLEALKASLSFASAGTTIQTYLKSGELEPLRAYLERIRRDGGFDFLGLADARGHVILRAAQLGRTQGDVRSISIVRAALGGEAAAATEVFTPEQLGNEDPALPARARFRTEDGDAGDGLVLAAAAPVRGNSGNTAGALYGGVLLNGSFTIVDHVWELLFRGDRFPDVDPGSVTIFLADRRISTNVRTRDQQRAIGTRASSEVSEATLRRGEIWRGRAFVVNRWYISVYDPIRDFSGRIIGMLSVGILESTYTSIRNRVILSFFGIATIGFFLIMAITYYMISNITRPIGEMLAATQNIAAGRFDQEVRANSPGEIALLAESFNAMLKSLRHMKGDLEQWGRTLEEKVKERTEELVTMQARVAQSERLASLGMLAAGVAHEVNNPLGAILALTALTAEDMKADEPNRENLEEVIRQTERCRDIVKGLLDFSRQSKGNTERIDLNRVLEDTLSLVVKQAMFLNIRVERDLDPVLPPVTADRSQFQQVFMNILMNAVQAMGERGTLSISSRRDPAGKGVEIAISDTGRGIPPEQIDRIFDPFFSTKESGQGTGLGLSIAYGIVTTHRGSISVDSVVGKGTTFTIRMPAAAPVADAAV